MSRNEHLRRGAKFEHAHYIQGSPKAGTARPDICEVTVVTRDRVYYRTETGMKMYRDREGFLADSVKRWL